jgi:hypothetical protein
LLIRVTVLANKLGWSLITISDLQKRIVTGFTTPLTLLAEIGIMANRALVTNSDNRICVTAITGNTFVLILVLLLSLLVDLVSKHLLEALITVFLNFLTNQSSHSREFSGHKSTSSVTLAARETLLVHLSTVALDAGNLFKTSLIFVRRNKQVTGDIHVLDLDFHLSGLVLHLSDDSITASITHLSASLA